MSSVTASSCSSIRMVSSILVESLRYVSYLSLVSCFTRSRDATSTYSSVTSEEESLMFFIRMPLSFTAAMKASALSLGSMAIRLALA